jgi:hypothetical protein
VHYLDAELNGVSGALSLYHRAGGQNFWNEFGGLHDATANTVTYEGFPSFSDVTLSTFNSPLPVTFGGFSSNCSKEGVELFWSTYSEQNASHWLIERSRDGVIWDVIANVPAYGNTNSTMYYEFTDAKAIGFEGYYRLLQVDFDGLSESFGPFYAGCSSSADEEMQLNVFPNPNKGNFILSLTNANEEIGEVEIKIISSAGKEVYSKKDLFNTNNQQINFYDLNLSKGSYLIRVVDGKGSFRPVKLIIT